MTPVAELVLRGVGALGLLAVPVGDGTGEETSCCKVGLEPGARGTNTGKDALR